MEKFEKLTGKQQLATLKRLLSYAKPYKKSLAWTLILTLIVTLGNLATPLLIKYILDNFIQDKSTDIAALSLWTGITFATFVVTSLVWYVEQLRFQKRHFISFKIYVQAYFKTYKRKGCVFMIKSLQVVSSRV